MDFSSVMASPSYDKAAETYKKAVAAAATMTAYTVLARSMARELFRNELRAAARWAASVARGRLLPRPKARRTKTIFIPRFAAADGASHGHHGGESSLYSDARAYLATRIGPCAMAQFCLTNAGARQRLVVSMVPGDSTTDVFEGVEFTWTLTTSQTSGGRGRGDASNSVPDSLALRFDAEQMKLALGRYVPFILAETEAARRQERALKIFMNTGFAWEGFKHHHPSTFDTVAMDPALRRLVVDDLDRFLARRDHYQRIGKAWKRGYLLHGPPGTGKSSLVAAMANYLRFNLYDLDLSQVYSNLILQKLLMATPNKSILVIEDIDCCFSATSREGAGAQSVEVQTKNGNGNGDCSESSDAATSRTSHRKGLPPQAEQGQGITLSGLLSFIDGLWSTSGEERIIVFTTNYKDRLDPVLLRPGRMDMHIYMGYCCWEAFKTLAKNYFLLDDHPLFPEIQDLLAEVEVTPATVSEMLLRSEDAGVALQGFVEFLQDMKKQGDGKQ
ncbi:hypothetical protein PR202_ga29807 [Eleusine coracana subsp. coracana]|uniref:AAA+ ATPase domain-containing protein n=1 Tax=Eleusine coracana subsp. coracana TaxID=191504 RepID=A0AAV5DN07_ELECO|nr:hypothetical protein PR202_ga29807 [Eleusine coracana subsp. coracana]